ncbi:MAG: FadR/GntR family transcriptional regulator [Micromonosporaceae bacterium]
MAQQQQAAEPGWRPVARTRAYQLVVDQIEEQIFSGALKVGDRLPGERELAGRLEVSRAAVREAIRMLEAQGVVRAGVGSGPGAGTVVAALPSEALTRLLRVHVALANIALDDVVEVQAVLERSSAAMAASHATPADLAVMQASLLAMGEEVTDRARFNELDTAFHVAVAEAARNRLVTDMTIAIRDSMRRPILDRFEVLGDRWAEVAEGFRAEHHAVYDAIVAGDADAAARLIEDHIRNAHSVLCTGLSLS